MGGERGATARQRLAGRICCACKRLLDPPYPGRERYCERCEKGRRCFVAFFLRDGWVCTFLEPDLQTPIGPIRTFGSEEKMRELIARTPTRMDLAGKQALAMAFEKGRGGFYLDLTAEPYRRLRR